MQPMNRQVWRQVARQVLNPFTQVKQQVEQQVRQLIRKEVAIFSLPYLDGQFSASLVASYDFLRSIGVDLPDYSIFSDQIQFNLIYPIDGFVVFAERPSVIYMKDKRLHKEGAPSVEYPDGTKCWSLNGVAVPQWLAETPWDKLDCSEFPKITNVQVRREFVRKVGVERLCKEMGSVILDKQGDYELHEIDLQGATGKWPYLKMLNPSIGTWHMECVGKTCKTVRDALRFRNQSDLEPLMLT